MNRSFGSAALALSTLFASVALLGGAGAAAADPGHTTPGSAWAVSSLPPGLKLDLVSCGGLGFCVGGQLAGNKLAVTNNLGVTWHVSALPSDVGGVQAISCATSENCLLTAFNDSGLTLVYSTRDAGAAWSEKASTDHESNNNYFGPWLSCATSMACIGAAFAGPYLDQTETFAGYTVDGGSSWTDESNNTAVTGQALVSCAKVTACYMVSGGAQPEEQGVTPSNYFNGYLSDDLGKTWRSRGNRLTGMIYANGLACPNTSSCVVVGNDSSDDNPGAGQAAAWTTSDGGTRWVRGLLPRSIADLADVSCVSATDCYAVGSTANAGVILASADGAHSWAVQRSNVDVESIACAAGSCLAVGGSVVARLVMNIAAVAVVPDGHGYYTVSTSGGVLSFGDAVGLGDLSHALLDSPAVAIALTPDGKGYWIATAGGGVYPFGDARNDGSLAGHPLAKPIVAFAPTPDGRGYYLVAADGGVFTFGDGRFLGSMVGKHLNAPIVGAAVDPATGGYWMVGADGGIFSFGAHFYGSAGALRLARPIVGMEALADGTGYRLVATDGGVFDFGAARFEGSLAGRGVVSPVVGIAAQALDGEYWLVQANGAVTAFGS